MAFSLRLQTREARDGLQALQQNAPRAIMRALNRTMQNVQTVAVRETARDMGLRQADVRPSIAIDGARPDRLVARLIATGARIPLIKFGATGPEPSRGRGRGVAYRLPGGRGRHPRAFIATMRSGHRGVFVRRGPSRSRAGRPRSSPGLPIQELFGPSIPRSFAKQFPAMRARADEMLSKNLQHEIDFLLRRSAGG